MRIPATTPAGILGQLHSRRPAGAHDPQGVGRRDAAERVGITPPETPR